MEETEASFRDGNTVTSEESVLRRWKEKFDELRERRGKEVETVEEEVRKISNDEVREALERMKNEVEVETVHEFKDLGSTVLSGRERSKEVKERTYSWCERRR